MHKSKLFVILSLAVFVLMGGSDAVAGSKAGNKNKPENKPEDKCKDDDKHNQVILQNEFALFDGSNPANQPNAGAICGAALGQPFTYNVAVANYGSDGFVRITYVDGDWVQFPIAAGGSFSLTQAAGSKAGKDAVVRVSNGTSAAQLSGVMSATGAKCGSCDALEEGGLGDAQCDAFLPN